MIIKFEYLGSPATLETAHNLIQTRGMTVPLMNASEGLRNAAVQAKIEFQRKGTNQFDAAQLLGS